MSGLTCIRCGGRNITVRNTFRLETGLYEIVRCDECGLDYKNLYALISQDSLKNGVPEV